AVPREVFVERAGHESQNRFLHGNFDLLTLAGVFARIQGRDDAERNAHTGGFIADTEGFRAVRAVVVPGAVRPSRDAVVGCGGVAVIRVRPPLAITARTGIDQPRIETLNRFVVETEALHHAFLIVLEEHVGNRNEPARDFDALFRFQVEHDAFLIYVDPQRFVRVGSGAGLHPEAAKLIALRRLDLDDLGAEMAQKHRAERPGQGVREVDYADILKSA